MTALRYYVFDEGGRWKVRFKGRNFPYPTREAAISAAIETARRISLVEEKVQVLLRDANGEWRIIWTSGQNDTFEDSTDQLLPGFAGFRTLLPIVA
jgi:hypothetical protein